MSSRGKKLFLNTGSSLIFQVTTIICGFILPRLILKAFGSEVNGLVNSITQFLGIISFLELGVGSVIQSSLYKPLADKDENQSKRPDFLFRVKVNRIISKKTIDQTCFI